MKRVMIVESIEDAIARRRHAKLEASPLLDGYKLLYSYPCVLEDSDSSPIMETGLPAVHLTVDALYGRVSIDLASHAPHYVIVHSGFVFHENVPAYEEAFSRLVSENPSIAFCIQERPGLCFLPNEFSNSGPVKDLHDTIFYEILGNRG